MSPESAEQFGEGKLDPRGFRPEHAVLGFAAAIGGVDKRALRFRVNHPDILHSASEVIGDLGFKFAGAGHWSGKLTSASFSRLGIKHGSGIKEHPLGDEAAPRIPYRRANSGPRSGNAAHFFDGQLGFRHEM